MTLAKRTKLLLNEVIIAAGLLTEVGGAFSFVTGRLSVLSFTLPLPCPEETDQNETKNDDTSLERPTKRLKTESNLNTSGPHS